MGAPPAGVLSCELSMAIVGETGVDTPLLGTALSSLVLPTALLFCGLLGTVPAANTTRVVNAMSQVSPTAKSTKPSSKALLVTPL